MSSPRCADHRRSPRPGLPLAFLLAATPAAPADAPAAPAAETGWLAAVDRQIRDGEYHLSVAASGDGWASPNREHGLRSTWRSGRLEVRPRLDAEAWQFTYELVGIGRGRAGAKPVEPVTAEEVDRGRLEWQRDGLEEWYINDVRGLEQGYRLDARPEGEAGDPVVLDAQVGGLLAYPSEDDSSIRFKTADGGDALLLRDLRVSDAAGRVLPACFVTGDGMLRLAIDDDGALYPLTIDPPLTSPSWTADGGQAAASLGISMAAAGDVNGDGYGDVIVGAHRWDNGQADEGRALVYLGSAAGLALSPSWSVESNQAGAKLGQSVASAGDVNGDGFSDVIVGASNYNNGQVNEGRAFVYHGSASGLALSAAWTAESNQHGAHFGAAVAGAGDVNGDGFSDVIVGAEDYDRGELDEGRAFVYLGSASSLAAAPAWSAEGNQASAAFGAAVASAGDVNGDGFSDVVVGAPRFDNGEADEGRALVYLGSASGLAASAVWTAESDQAEAAFGAAVASAGDVNGDGFADVVVGADSFSNPQNREGKAFVYHGSAAGLAAAAAWTAEGNQPLAHFAESVAGAGDVNGDGYADVIVGAAQYKGSERNEGKVSVYHGSAAGLGHTASWTAEGAQAGASFGRSVASAGDVNGDGFSDVIVGAPNHDAVQADEGRAFAYLGSAAGLQLLPAWSAEGDGDGDSFGYSVASAGDVNGDGFSDVIVGARWYGNGVFEQGAAFVYHGSPSGLGLAAAWSVEGSRGVEELGESVASAGDVNGDGFSDVIVSSRYSTGAIVYHGSATGLTAKPAWTAEVQPLGLANGRSVAGAGDVNGDGFADVIVGSIGYENGEDHEGAAYIYHGSASGLGALPARVLEGNQAVSDFGGSVASAGDVNGDGYSDVIIGARNYDDPELLEGRVFVYHGSPFGVGSQPAWTAESNEMLSRFGTSVASAGDVNGDGYSDVIIGAAESCCAEDRAFVYHGSASGLAATAGWSAAADQPDDRFGHSVASAGDVNGDGYSDVIVGAYWYNNGQPEEGRAFVYHGSALGLGLSPAWTAESDIQSAWFGISVAHAGDVNGDGFSDVIVGAPLFTLGQQERPGRAFLFYGNGGDGLDRIPRQARADGSAPIDILGQAGADGFLVRARGCTPFGRGQVRLEVEVKTLANAFNGAGLRTTSYTDTGLPGPDGSFVDLERASSLFDHARAQKWRLRLRARTPLPWVSRWMSPPANALRETDLRIVLSPGAVASGSAP